MHKELQEVPIEQYLLDSPLSTLFIQIREFSLKSLHLLMYGAKNFVGFGKTKNFCMYFIGLHNNQIIFSSRIEYKNSRDETNIVRLPFMEANRAKIFDYICIIYNNYAKMIGKVGLTKQVVKLYDTVLIHTEGEDEEIYIGENHVIWHPIWTGIRGRGGQRMTAGTDTILGGDHTKGFISSETPLAKAILGKPEGAVFAYTNANGEIIDGVILKITSNKK